MAYVATSWAYREVVSSSKLQQMSDNDAYLKTHVDAIESQWADYTPALTSTGTNPTLGTGATVSGRYIKMGRTVQAQGLIILGTGATAGTGNYRLNLPVTNRDSFPIGFLWLFDSSATLTNMAIVTTIGSGLFGFRAHGSTAEVGAAAPWPWAAGDQIRWNLTYESAA